MRVVIVEDELIHQQNAALICDDLGWEVVGMANNFFDGLALVLRHQPDVVLLDILLAEGGNGLELAVAIRKHLQPIIVMVTSQVSSEFLQQAAANHIRLYLAKPLQRDTLLAQVQLELLNHVAIPEAKQTHLLLKHATGTDRVAISSIYFLSTAGNRYCRYVCNEREYRRRIGLQEALDELPSQTFIRIHKSYGVALQAIKSLLENDELLLVNGEHLPIGEPFKRGLLQALRQ